MPASDEVLEKRLRDRDYVLWVKTLRCCAAALEGGAEAARCSPGAVDAHHAGTSRGMSQKADDRTCIPLCHFHHVGCWHAASGPFKTWDRDQRRAWALRMIGQTQALHARGSFDNGSGSIPW